MTQLEIALMIAEKAHVNQTYDIFPYMYYIKRVVEVATDLGYDESILIACALHDSIEDDGVSYNDIKKAFGQEIAEIVFAVTDELGRNRIERKSKTYPKIQANWKATVVKICDRIANAEHSKQYSRSKFQMYQNEHETFCTMLMSKHHPHSETNRAWKRLNKLMIK